MKLNQKHYQAWTKAQIERFFGTVCDDFTSSFESYTVEKIKVISPAHFVFELKSGARVEDKVQILFDSIYKKAKI